VIFAGAVALVWQKNESNRRLAEEQERRAKEQGRIAESRRLATKSSSVLAEYPQRSLLLAVEAVKAEQPLPGVRVAVDEQSLREALGFIGGQLVARADGRITTVAISPDNRRFAKILADRNFKAPAGFGHRHDCSYTRSGLLAADMYPIAAT